MAVDYEHETNIFSILSQLLYAFILKKRKFFVILVSNREEFKVLSI